MFIEELVWLIVLALFVVGPVLSFVALATVRQLSRRVGSDRLEPLEARIAALERRLAPSPSTPVDVVAGAVVPAAPVPEARPSSTERGVPRAVAPRATSAPAIDIEALIGGRWLNRIGILALLLAVAFFLKFAFDNNWIGPAGRVAIGLVGGTALLVYSQLLLRRSFLYFSEGIAGLGAGVLYLSLYAAWGFYHLVPQGAALAGMAAVTAALVVLALGRDSERLALIALAGGLLTPGVLATGVNPQPVLFTYLALLDAGLLAVTGARSWRTLELPAIAGTLLYFVSWYDKFYDPTQLAATCGFATLLFAELAALPVIQARRGRPLWPEQLVGVLVNAAWFPIALYAMLHAEHRWPLTFAVLGLAAAYLVASHLVRPVAATAAVPAHALFAGLALTFVTVAIPIRLEGEWITMAWAVEGLVLVASGLRADNRWLRGAGFVLFVLALVLLAGRMPESARPLLNARFSTFVVLIAALGGAFYLARSKSASLAPDERRVFGAAGIVANALAVWALSLEVWDVLGRVRLGADPHLARQAGLSVLWTLCASALILVGVVRGSAALRWQGLALIGVAVAKVFLFDLSFLERVYRILSFFALGLVLLVLSFLYQRRPSAGARSPG